ncbi:MAG: DMT family transporter [Candidatus Saccharibacteria bacterium]
MNEDKTKSNTSLSQNGLFHLLVVYIVWSTTYLAIRLTVMPGAGFTPFAMGAMRLLAAGVLLAAYAGLRGHRLRLSRQELWFSAVTGILLWVGGTGLVIWAEQTANSGFAALVIASTPIWVALFDAILDKKTPSLLLVVSLIIGFGGVILLMAPSLLQGSSTSLMAAAALVTAAVSWSAGSVYQARSSVKMVPTVLSTYQHIFGGLALAVMWIAAGEPMPHPTATAWGAWAYLVIFGSVIAFTSFIKALKLLPINIATTYSYVNPVLALLLGWWLLDEQLTVWTLAGAILIVVGIIGVFRGRKVEPDQAVELEEDD